MGFSSQEYWSGLPFPSPGDLPDPGIEPGSPTLQADTLPSEAPGSTEFCRTSYIRRALSTLQQEDQPLLCERPSSLHFMTTLANFSPTPQSSDFFSPLQTPSSLPEAWTPRAPRAHAGPSSISSCDLSSLSLKQPLYTDEDLTMPRSVLPSGIQTDKAKLLAKHIILQST